jgi:hypothetical protein
VKIEELLVYHSSDGSADATIVEDYKIFAKFGEDESPKVVQVFPPFDLSLPQSVPRTDGNSQSTAPDLNNINV